MTDDYSKKRQEFDSLLGGETSLPLTITPRDFINARISEIQALTEAIENPQRTAMIFQQLPKKMRRRVMSHNAKRMPNRLKQAHSNLLAKCSAREVGKRPSRKYRRRPSNLQEEYVRRQRNNTWLETHIWHAKRFHMVNRWGYKLAHFPNDKSYRACYRASAHHCLCQDVSFLWCIQLEGSVGNMLSGLSKLSNDSFKRKSDLSGQREGSASFHSIAGEPIGQVSFVWSPGEGKSDDMKWLWLWAHPAFASQLCLQLEQVFSCCNVSISQLHNQLLRFRLIGPKSLEVLSGAFKPLDDGCLSSWVEDTGYYSDPLRRENLRCQSEYLKKFLVTSDPGQLPPRSVLPALVTTLLPKLPEALRNRVVDVEATLPDPVACVTSPLWCEETRKAITEANVRIKSKSDEKELNLVSSVSPLPVERTPVSVLLVHRPGRQDTNHMGYGCGVDVICPAGWGRRVWLCLIHNGGRAAGLRDFDIVETDVSMKAKFIPDSDASRKHTVSISQNNRDKYFRLPPAKRPNYQKLGVPSPFELPWKRLQEEWGSSELMRVYVVSCGKMMSGSCICIPSLSDLEDKDCPPVEPPHPDRNKMERREAKLKHMRALRKIAKVRKVLRSKDTPEDELPSSKETVENHRINMEKLWLGDCENIRLGNIRETAGFISEGNYSLLEGKCAGYGYIASSALESLKPSQRPGEYIVLTRSQISLHYVFANLKVI